LHKKSFNQHFKKAIIKQINKPINITIMEATIQQNNISTNVSINIATLMASGQNANNQATRIEGIISAASVSPPVADD